MNMNVDLRALGANEARLNVTYDGQNADLNEAVPFGASDAEIKAWAREAIMGGAFGVLRARGPVDLSDFVVDRFPANAKIPENRIFLRPITPFG